MTCVRVGDPPTNCWWVVGSTARVEGEGGEEGVGEEEKNPPTSQSDSLGSDGPASVKKPTNDSLVGCWVNGEGGGRGRGCGWVRKGGGCGRGRETPPTSLWDSLGVVMACVRVGDPPTNCWWVAGPFSRAEGRGRWVEGEWRWWVGEKPPNESQ